MDALYTPTNDTMQPILTHHSSELEETMRQAAQTRVTTARRGAPDAIHANGASETREILQRSSASRLPPRITGEMLEKLVSLVSCAVSRASGGIPIETSIARAPFTLEG